MSKSLFYCSTLPTSTQVALKCAGYETVDDLAGASAENLCNELGINIADSRALINMTQAPKEVLMSQSVASLAQASVSTCTYTAVNKILGGGLPRGHILEISGPPGSFKESLVCDFVRTFVEADEEVICADMQNMTSPDAISELLKGSSTTSRDLISYTRLHTLPDLLIFLHNLSEIRPKTGLLILNSISFGFQSHPDLSPSRRTAMLEKIRQTLLQACVSKNLTIIATSQMATKMLNLDGSAATFDTGARAVMVPQLGPTYLPPGRSYRLIVVPGSRATGVVRLFASPGGQQRQDNSPREEYVLVRANDHYVYSS
ncbi:hypothetical protein HYDPIDRAFT_95048 [Hydnomerulius pinastri MD-312]|uniref:DNA recombination and repair protein Rad51-like C-terminal domain-containing protein n=1 Tax=Hydnomerulius pinastri MD-312 TaxID=994086 RepID=A0A0C9WD55_9AGAM|nr:hypothetical protein HYDPIDRAFT_95048 [Hydnomerulius pinastri MD-312]